MKFYYLAEIETNDNNRFIDEYVSMYFGEKDVCAFPRLNITTHSVENRIIALMKQDKWTRKDVLDILAWKTGAIKQRCYKKGEPFDYTQKTYWHTNDCFCLTPPGRKAIEKEKFIAFCDYISKHKQELSYKATKDHYHEAFEEMSKISPNGIGTVYLITLLFFLSKGLLPIYDRFVSAALKALESGIKPGNEIVVATPPSKDSAIKVKDELYDPFISSMNSNRFANYDKCTSIEERRKIDQALWTYGHYFSVKEKLKET